MKNFEEMKAIAEKYVKDCSCDPNYNTVRDCCKYGSPGLTRQCRHPTEKDPLVDQSGFGPSSRPKYMTVQDVKDRLRQVIGFINSRLYQEDPLEKEKLELEMILERSK